MRRTVLALLLVALLPASACRAGAPAPAAPRDSTVVRPAPVLASRGMVVSGHGEATQIGVAVLQAGGNAVDAAVAVGFALAVVLPNAGNVGGGGFLLVRQTDGTATSLDFRETAPAAATGRMFLDENGVPVSGRSVNGHLASGVPGTVAGLLEAHARWGRLPLAQVIEPAIRLAEGGYSLTRRDAHLLNLYRNEFTAFPSTARYFTTGDGRDFRSGERFTQRDLGAVLTRIRDGGRDGFYRGRTADLIVAEMQRGGGIITHADLEAYQPVERPVLTGEYRGHRLLTMGPPSTGGVALLQMLSAVEPFDVRGMGVNTPATTHLYGEVMRRAFADRARWLGDPGFVDVPVAGMLDPDYIRERMQSFSPTRASTSTEVSPGTPEPGPEGTETTHYSIVDEEGTAIAVTYTINDYFGSKVVVDGAGFFLNDEMDDFAAAPGRSNIWGLVEGENNRVRPRARPASSMTPTIIEDAQGRPMLVVGSPGGSRIITTVFQVVTDIIDHGLDVRTAVSVPRFHNQWRPDHLEVEPAFPAETRAALEGLGWTIQQVNTFGAADAILIEYGANGTRRLYGGADPRRENDTAGGY